MLASKPALYGSVLSTASRYGALQTAFSTQLREWHWQRSNGTFYQIWQPPGVVFSHLKKDHYLHGRSIPPWSEWGFRDPAASLRLVLGALGGRWAVWQARRRREEQWVVADSDDSCLFHAFYRSMNSFGLDPADPGQSFPNLRLLHVNERAAPKFFGPRSLGSVHVHMPWAARTTRPTRAALVTQRFIADVSTAMEEQGELHIVTDSESIVEEVCGNLTRSQLFTPCFGFPFHETGVPSSYPMRDLLGADAAEVHGGRARRAFFYTRWEKRPPQLPNFRFQGGAAHPREETLDELEA